VKRALVLALAIVFASGCAETSEHSDVSYDDRFDDDKMDIYVPTGDGPFPGVMFIHGGAWLAGSRSAYTDAAKRLARSGYVTATIDYRLVPDIVYPENVQDCFCALAFLRAHATDYHLDPNRIAVWGYSAGGHLAALVGVSASYGPHAPDCKAGKTGPPAAVVAGAGVYDLRDEDTELYRRYFGVGPNEGQEKYAGASPIVHVAPNMPPFLFINGTDDWFVREEQAHRMKDVLVARGNDARVHEVSGGGHLLNSTIEGSLTLEESDLTTEGWIAATAFLDRTVGRK
jgi:acetyl esterase/lipase